MKTILTITAIFSVCLLGACAKKDHTVTTTTDTSHSTGYTK